MFLNSYTYLQIVQMLLDSLLASAVSYIGVKIGLFIGFMLSSLSVMISCECKAQHHLLGLIQQGRGRQYRIKITQIYQHHTNVLKYVKIR